MVAADPAVPIGGSPPLPRVGRPGGLWSRFRRHRMAVLGLVVAVGLVLVALAAPVMTKLGIIADPLQQDVPHADAGMSLAHPLGTDNLGRDLLARVIWGTRISLSVGLLVQVIHLVIGGSIGLVAGFFGGRADNLLMRFTDAMYAFPDLVFVLVIAAVLGPGYLTILIAIGLVGWVQLARLVRGQVFAIKESQYIEAAVAAGDRPAKVVLAHVVPNSAAPVIVSLTFGVPAAIFTEAFLSFVGVGIRPPIPDWGVMVSGGYSSIFYAPLEVLVPSAAIALATLAFNLVGDGLRDALDPYGWR